VNLTEGDFSHSKLPSDKDDQSKDPSKIQDKLKEIDPETKILTPEQIEAILKAEVEKLENFLKERDEIKRAKAESELANLLSELIDESSTYILDDDLEIVKVVKIKGIVLDNDTDLPIEGVSIYAGILGTFKTDNNGKFEILNVPKDTNYLISAVKEGFLFNPPYHSGTVDMAIEIVFRADIN
jgi:hypothetical protein